MHSGCIVILLIAFLAAQTSALFLSAPQTVVASETFTVRVPDAGILGTVEWDLYATYGTAPNNVGENLYPDTQRVNITESRTSFETNILSTPGWARIWIVSPNNEAAINITSIRKVGLSSTILEVISAESAAALSSTSTSQSSSGTTSSASTTFEAPSSTSSSSPSQTAKPASQVTIPLGGIIGLVIGLVLAHILLVFFFLRRCRRRRNARQPSVIDTDSELGSRTEPGPRPPSPFTVMSPSHASSGPVWERGDGSSNSASSRGDSRLYLPAVSEHLKQPPMSTIAVLPEAEAPPRYRRTPQMSGIPLPPLTNVSEPMPSRKVDGMFGQNVAGLYVQNGAAPPGLLSALGLTLTESPAGPSQQMSERASGLRRHLSI